MTDATELPLSANSSLNSTLLDAANQPVLHRSGELRLEKIPDRFSFCPVADRSAEALSLLGTEVRTAPILAAGLIEAKVAPDRLEALMQTARSSEAIAFVSHVYQLCQSPGTLLYLTDQLTVQFAETVDAEQMRTLAAQVGLRILKLVATVPKAFVFQVTAGATVNPLKLADQLLQRSDILLAEPNVAVLRQPCYRPRESGYAQQWYLHHEGGESLKPGSHIFAEPAWNITRGKRSIAVAVVDDAIDFSHPDFQSEGKWVAPVNFAARLAAEQTSRPDLINSHATACARLIAADETGKGMIGVAPGCALMPMQIDDWIDDRAIEQICEWAIEKGADVLYCGWSAAAVYLPLSLRQRVALTQVATQGRDGRGCVIIFPAGNANRPIDGVVNEQGWDQVLSGATHWLNGFAIHPDVVTVAACTSLNQKSASSNWGDGISVAAPGGNAPPVLYTQRLGYLATAPIVSTPQTGRSIQAILRPPQSNSQPENEPPLIGDTSAAAAIVAGVAALILSVNPDLTAAEVRQILEQTADRISDPEVDRQLGLALGSYEQQQHSAGFGYGKVNLFKALQQAQRLAIPLPLPYRWNSYANLERLAIPDGDLQGVTSPIQVADSDLIRDIEIKVELEHPFLSDLNLYLLPPWGKPILLQSRTLGRLAALRITYSLDNTLWLKSTLGHSAQGTWQLQLIDRIPEGRGQLRQWQLNLGT